MKGKIFNKARLAGAVMLATAGVAMSTAQADSLLAPVVISDSVAGYETYFNFKMKGTQSFGAGGDLIHYTYIKKGTSIADLFNTATPCLMENNTGKGSKGDMIFQDARGNTVAYNGNVPADGSTPNGYSAGDFVGMIVIDDENNNSSTRGAPEGDTSGFAYIVNPVAQVVQDYKLLNNHRTAESGDFSAGFISKHVVDFAWQGSVPTANPVTGWTLGVTGPDMSKHSGGYNSTYGLTVKVSQDQRAGEDSPEDAVIGAYNNDEVVISGDQPLYVTCMASFSHSAFLTPLQNAGSTIGGWTRKSIIPQADAFAGVDTAKEASGAIVYRADSWSATPDWTTTMQVETGGHLAPGANHVNRPY